MERTGVALDLIKGDGADRVLDLAFDAVPACDTPVVHPLLVVVTVSVGKNERERERCSAP